MRTTEFDSVRFSSVRLGLARLDFRSSKRSARKDNRERDGRCGRPRRFRSIVLRLFASRTRCACAADPVRRDGLEPNFDRRRSYFDPLSRRSFAWLYVDAPSDERDPPNERQHARQTTAEIRLSSLDIGARASSFAAKFPIEFFLGAA